MAPKEHEKIENEFRFCTIRLSPTGRFSEREGTTDWGTAPVLTGLSILPLPSQLFPSALRVYPFPQWQTKERTVSWQICSHPPLSIRHSFSTRALYGTRITPMHYVAYYRTTV